MAAEGESYGYDQPEDNEKGITREPVLPPYQPSVGFSPPPPQAGYPLPQAGNPPSGRVQQSSTTVVVQQPQQRVAWTGPRNWGTPLCSCFDDMSICLCGMFLGHCLASQVAQDMGEHCCVPCCVPGAMIGLRLKLRTQENIEGSYMNDCCTVAFCGPCALCQLAREVKVINQRSMTIVGMQPVARQPYF